MGSSQEDSSIMRCSVLYFIELKGGQARVNRLAVQQYDQVVALHTVAVLYTRSVLAFLNMVSNIHGLLTCPDSKHPSCVRGYVPFRSTEYASVRCHSSGYYMMESPTNYR